MKRWPGSDRNGGYGWISIALHWLTAAAILALLFIGDSIATAGDEGLKLHTSVAACTWLVLAVRVVWRLAHGHPPSPSGRATFAHVTGVIVHYAMLGGLALMLISGPATAWSSGAPIRIFALAIESPWPPRASVHELALAAHRFGAMVLVWGIVLHVAGVLKHMFIDRDGLLDRIMAPPRAADRGRHP